MQSQQKKPVLLVTSALPYVNNIVHLGNIIGSVLSADVYVRYARSKNINDVIFVGGVDEYGTATEVKARELKVSCKEVCDKNEKIHNEIYKWFNISFDCYGRTSQPNGDPSIIQPEWPQTRITHKIFRDLCDSKYVIEKTEHVMDCDHLKTFVADRFVIGTCPHCQSNKADGDQCDKCGRLLTPTELIDPRYKPNPSYTLEVRTTDNLFIDTQQIWNDHNLTEWFNSNQNTWTHIACSITNEWLSKGLQPRSITRDLLWGTAGPDTVQFGSKYSSKVFYVWFDAPIGYIGITEHILGQQKSEEIWRDPQTKLIQFMAHDNVPFHSVIFPVTLYGSNYSRLTNVDIVSTSYLMFEGNKFSKSKGTGLFCDEVIEISKRHDIGCDYWRLYLIYIRPEKGDTNFCIKGFEDFINHIMIKNFGNLVHRVASVAYQIRSKKIIDTINAIDTNNNSLSELEDNLNSECQTFINEYDNLMDNYKLSDGLKITLRYSARLNLSVNEFEPWLLIRDESNQQTLYRYITLAYRHLIILCSLLHPFAPDLCDKVVKLIEIKTPHNFRDKSIRSLINSSDYSINLPLTKPAVIIKPFSLSEI